MVYIYSLLTESEVEGERRCSQRMEGLRVEKEPALRETFRWLRSPEAKDGRRVLI